MIGNAEIGLDVRQTPEAPGSPRARIDRIEIKTRRCAAPRLCDMEAHPPPFSHTILPFPNRAESIAGCINSSPLHKRWRCFAKTFTRIAERRKAFVSTVIIFHRQASRAGSAPSHIHYTRWYVRNNSFYLSFFFCTRYLLNLTPSPLIALRTGLLF